MNRTGLEGAPSETRSDARVVVGDVWLDLQQQRYGRKRTVMVTSFNWPFAHVVAVPSGRHTRIHQETLERRFLLLSRLPLSGEARR